MSSASRRNVVRTLVINGYVLERFETPTPNTFLVRVRKTESLGAQAKSILLFADRVSDALHNRLIGDARRHGCAPLIVSTAGPLALRSQTLVIPLRDFYQLLGGEVRTDRIFNPKLPAIMNTLGHNQRPTGFSGTPDDLLELYSKEALQFLLDCPVRRYGQERRFEKLPDGLALAKNGFNVLFDAKAYAKRFHPSAADIRQFLDYVRDMNQRYREWIGPMSLFLVITGSLSTKEHAIKSKADDFSAESSIPIVFIRVKDLGIAVQLSRAAGRVRAAINWRRIFVPYIFEIATLRSELTRVRKDAIVD